MSDYDLVILSGNKTRCQHLDQDGKRCKNVARFKKGYHGDDELYTRDDTAWVIVELCEAHAETTFDVPKDLSDIKKVWRRK